MIRRSIFALISLVLFVSINPLIEAEKSLSLTSTEGLELRQVEALATEYGGRKALKLMQAPNAEGEATVALLTDSEFQDGTIEVDLVGKPAEGAFGGARGFVGVVFRAASEASRFECFYLRPTNGRAEDQLRRNHSSQYISYPDYPWHRLRQETPGKYEAYVDLVPGEWTKVKIVVSGTQAKLYVHGASQPTLIVNDLKLGASSGKVGLWVGPGTESYFSDLRITE